ncbi:MAG: hypothetical protein MI923_05945, partial [Phycisphaerales bacterium]|nr:hypothetical protein [Phycisphaerales bacterium]
NTSYHLQPLECLLKLQKSKNKASCDLIRFSQGKWINTYGKVYTGFLFMGHAFWKENIEDSKIIGIKHFKLLSKDNNG